MKQRISYFLVSLFITFCFAAEAQIPAPAEMTTLDDFSDGNFNSNPQWSVIAPSDNWTVSGGQLLVNELNGSFAVSTPFTRTTDAWQFDYVMDGGFAGQILDYFFFMTSASNDPRTASGYRVRYQLGNTSNVVSLQTVTNGVAVNTIASFNNGLTNSLPRITIRRKNNTWEFYVGATLRGTGSEATYSNSICAYQGLFVFLSNSSVPYNHGFDNIRYRQIPFGPFASAVFLGTCRQPAGSFFNTTGEGANLIDQNNKTFTDTFFGTYIQNSGALVLKGAEVKTFRGENSNVCIPKMYYRIIPQGATPGAFSDTLLNNIIDNCSGSTFPTGGPCNVRDQKWQRNDMSLDLTTLPPGNYTFQVYYEISGSASSSSGCGDTIILNNGGNFYNSTFIIQVTPTLTSTNPTTCSGTNGSITIKGSAPNTKYAVTYQDDGVTVGPDSLTSNSSGDIVISGLNAGVYTSFSISNACTIPVNGTITLSDPTFSITPSSTPNTVCNGSGGGTTPCSYSGPKVVINEIMVMPGSNYGPGADDILGTFQSLYTGQEWVELYNPSPCDAVDISCYVLGDKSSATSSGAVSFPQGTIIPPLGFLVVGGSNAPNVNINVNNLRSTPNFTGTNNWRFNNVSGSCALYDKNLQIVDAVYWGPSQDDINDRVNSVGDAFEYTLPYPAGVSCNYPSGAVIPAPKDNASQFEYIGNIASTSVGAQTIGKSTYRSADDSNTWIVGGVGAANNTPGSCNSTCVPPFTGGGTTGTCNGSVTVGVSGGVGTLSYAWKDQSNNQVGTTSTVNNLCAGTYTVTVTDNTTNCSNTATVTVSDNIPQVTPTFDPIAPICQGSTAPALPSQSTNSTPITGTWFPATIDNQNGGTYTFTPDPGQCAGTATITITVNTPIAPTFGFSSSINICNNGSAPSLPATSTNGITGTWTPDVVNNTAGGTYTFVPAAGQCATNFVLTVNITSLTLETSKTDNTVCNGSGGGSGACVSKGNGVVINEVRHYPIGGASTQGIIPATGRIAREYIELYNPTCDPIDISCFMIASASKTSSTPSANSDFAIILPQGVILQPKSHYVIGSSTLNTDPTVVDFKTDLNPSNYCSTTPNNMVMGNTDGWVALYKPDGTPVDAIYWTVAANQSTKITTDDDFNDNPCTPASVGTCNTSGVVLRSATDIYNFNQSVISYVGITAANPLAPTGKTFSRIPDGGAWQSEVDSSIVNNCNNGQCDVPTPTTGTCNGTASVTVTGGTAPYAYEWKDAQKNIVSTLVSASALCPGEYCVKITDNTGCADSVCVTILDASTNVTPQFDPIDPICAGATAPVLPTTSKNNVTGTWNPAIVDNQNTADYTFTPESGQCASTVTLTITVNPKQEPLFDPVAGFCQGAILTQVLLPTTSNNSIAGTWNPPGLSSAVAGDILYVFTPTSGVCADTASLVVKVTANTTPTFSFGTSLTICAGRNVPVLPNVSDNGVNGTWNPAVVDNQNSRTYTFTPDAGQCATTATFTVTVNQPVTPTFPYGTSLTVCSGDPTPNLQGISTNNIVGLWNPTNVSNTQSDVYTFTPAPGSCATNATFTVTVIQRPSVTVRPDTTLYHNAVYPGDIFSGLPAGSTVSWINSNPGIGLPSSGNGNVPAFTAINIGSNPVTATITVNSTNGNCAGTVRTYKITVLPLNRDVFVPNVFTPNGDAKNDQLFVFGNYITKLEMRIFNQWGELVKVINNPSVGWDGTHKGKPQPVGVYVYTLRATLADGTEVNKKGSITLLR
jgi:gliding motility-associated-like protein